MILTNENRRIFIQWMQIEQHSAEQLILGMKLLPEGIRKPMEMREKMLIASCKFLIERLDSSEHEVIGG